MEPITVVYIFAALCLKHFVCDFPLQTALQYKNKGTYGHIGGIIHAGIHIIGTVFVLLAFVPMAQGIIISLAMIDGLVHYHIDWAKMNLNNHYKLTPTNSELFWHLLGLDQLLHYMTYVVLLWYLVANQ
jgi:Protein of unknown function (DUF3307)